MSHNNPPLKSSRPAQDSRSTRHGGHSGSSGSGVGAASTSLPPTATTSSATTRTTSRPPHERGYNSQTDKGKGKQQSFDSSENDQDEEEEQRPLIETSTHIVVEHHRTGTVKTHVFSSRDGQPSMLGHTIPTPNNINNGEVEIGKLLDSKIENMNSAFEESLHASTKESIKAVKEALRENEDRRSCRHMVAATESMDVQIREEVVPKLNSIAKLLEDNISVTGRESPTSVRTTSSSMEHMDTRSPGAAPAASDPLMLEKLTKIEDKIETMYKVVIDGEVPPLPTAGSSDQRDAAPGAVGPNTSASEAVDPAMLSRLEEMRREMLTFPDTLQQTHERMGVLIQALTDNQQSQSGKVEVDIGKVASNAEEMAREQEEESVWKEYTRSMHHSQYALALDLDSKLEASTKSYKYALKTFLHFMLMTHKQAKGMNERVDSALQEMLGRSQVDPQFHSEFSVAIDAMRADLQRILEELPTAITEALGKVREQEMKDCSSQRSTRSLGEPNPAAISRGVYVVSPAPPIAYQGQQPSPPELPELPAASIAPAGSIAASQENVSTPLPRPSSEVGPAAAPLTAAPAGVEHLVTVVESLQINIAALMQKFTEIPVWNHPPPPPPATAVEEATPGDKAEVERELPPIPPPRETPMERQARMLKVAAAAAGSEQTGGSVENAEDPASRSTAEPPVVIGGKDAAKETPGKEEVPESNGKEKQAVSSADASSAPAPAPTPNFLKELDAMSKTLSGLVEAVASTSSKLTEGQSAVQSTLLTEIQKVMYTLNPPVTEEEQEKMAREDFQRMAAQVEADEKKRVEDKKNAGISEEKAAEEAKKKKDAEEAVKKAADERSEALTQIALVPQLFGSVETMGFMVGSKVDDVGAKVDALGAQLALGSSTTGQVLLTIQQQVGEISTGALNDSAALGSINQHLAVITGVTGTSSDQCLKEQVAEAIRTATDVYEIVDDVKKISERTLENQESLTKKLEEWQRRQDEGFENLGKKHEDSWNTWNALHGQNMTGLDNWHARHEEHMLALENWHRRHDLSMHGMEEWQNRHGQGLAEWQQKHDEAINIWHQNHSQSLDRLEQKHDQGLERLEQRHCYGCAVANDVPAGEAAFYQPPPPLPEAMGEASTANPVPRSRSPGPPGAEPQTSVHGQSESGAECDDCADPNSFNRQLHEFLRDTVPGYNGGCLRCGKASDSKSQWTSGTAAPEPFTGYATPRGTGIQLDPNAFHGTGRLLSPAENIADIYKSREAASKAPATSSGKADVIAAQTAGSLSPGSVANRGVETSSRVPSTSTQSANIPQAFYDILRPFFQRKGAEIVDSKIWAELQLENSQLKGDFDELKGEHDLLATQSSQLMVSSMEKDRLLSVSLEERTQREAELAESRQELKRSNDMITQLYREGLGLKCAKDIVEGLPSKTMGEGDDSDVKSVGSLHTPRYGLMNEAADQLRETLDEYREQTSILRQEILQLDLEKQQHLQEQATRTMIRPSSGSGTPSASATISDANDFTDTDAAEDENDEVIEVRPQSRQRRSRPTSMVQLRGEATAVASSSRGGGGGAYVTSASHRQSLTGVSQRGSGTGRGRRVSDTSNPAAFTASASSSSRPPSGSGPSPSMSRSQPRSQHKRASIVRNRSMGPSRSSRSSTHETTMVPQLEAEIRVCRDGVVAETLLKSKNILTEEQFDSVQRTRNESGRAAEDTAVWSLNCDFQVKMVNHP